MRGGLRILAVGVCCLMIAAGVVAWIAGLGSPKLAPEAMPPAVAGATEDTGGYAETFPDPNAPAGSAARVYIEPGEFDADIASTAYAYTGTVHDYNSLDDLREALRGKGRRGLTDRRSQFEQLKLDSAPSLQQAIKAVPLARSIGLLHMYDGKFAEANEWLEQAMALANRPEISPEVQAQLHALLGVAALRRGEIENCLDCVGPSSCIFPIAAEAVHRQQDGSRDALRHFTA